MNADELSPRDKIILATIYCIEKEGLQTMSIRSIAKQAGVNVAAINYYFGSKEKLIEQVLKSTTEEFVGLWQEALESREEPRERIREFFCTCMEGALRYPGITKAHLFDPLMQNDYSGYFVERLNTMLMDIQRDLEAHSDKQKEVIRMNLVQIISSIFFPAIMPEMFRDFAGSSFSDAGTRKAYVDFLIDHYFVPEIQ